jgi:hypothetical protein
MPITEESLEAVNGEWQGPMASILCPYPTYRVPFKSDASFAGEDASLATISKMDLANMANESRTQRTHEEAGRAAFEKVPPLLLYDDPIGCCASPSGAATEYFTMMFIAPDGEGGFKSTLPESGKIPVLGLALCLSPCLLVTGCCLGANCPGAMLPVSEKFVQSYEGRLEDRGAWCKDLSCGRVDGTEMGQPLISERQVITNQPELISASGAAPGVVITNYDPVEEATIPDYLRLGIDAEGFAEYLVRIGFLRKRSDKEVARILNFKGNEDYSDLNEEQYAGPDNWSRQELEDEFQLLARMSMLRYTFNPESVSEARKSESWIDDGFGKPKLDAVAEMSGQNAFFSKGWFDEAERVFPWFPGRLEYWGYKHGTQVESDRQMIKKEFNWQRWWCVTGYDIGAYIK